MKTKAFILCAIAAWVSAPAMAGVIVQNKTASFVSDLEPNVTLKFDTFDNLGGTLVLTDVRVEVSHDGGASLRADNDDDFKETNANGRIVRTWSLSGPNAFSFGNKTVTTNVVHLGVDNGDDGVFDANGPDGTDFGNVNYPDELVSDLHPNKALYETNGPGSVDFTADVLLMVNDLQFDVAPDQWQLEVQDPYLHINVKVTYLYSVVPVPAAVWLGGLGLGVAGWIRRRVA